MLYPKAPGMEAKLCFIGHALMENRNGLFVEARLTMVSGYAERLAALDMIEPYADRPDSIVELREINVTPHIAQNTSRRSAIDRTTRHPGYDISQRVRKRIEEGFGWMKTIGGMRKPKCRSREKVAWSFTFAATHNLIRLPKLIANRHERYKHCNASPHRPSRALKRAERNRLLLQQPARAPRAGP
jgi:hypothetical protein